MFILSLCCNAYSIKEGKGWIQPIAFTLKAILLLIFSKMCFPASKIVFNLESQCSNSIRNHKFDPIKKIQFGPSTKAKQYNRWSKKLIWMAIILTLCHLIQLNRHLHVTVSVRRILRRWWRQRRRNICRQWPLWKRSIKNTRTVCICWSKADSSTKSYSSQSCSWTPEQEQSRTCSSSRGVDKSPQSNIETGIPFGIQLQLWRHSLLPRHFYRYPSYSPPSSSSLKLVLLNPPLLSSHPPTTSK